MIVIGVILFFTFFIICEWIYIKVFDKEGVPEKKVKPTFFMNTERYYHPGHTWVELKGEDQSAEIGPDSFTQKIMGPVEEIELPHTGQIIHQGNPLWTFIRGKRRLTQVSPITGKVMEVNAEVANNKTSATQPADGTTWMIKIHPLEVRQNLNNLMQGALARRWQDMTKTLFTQNFFSQLGPVYQDGGELADDVNQKITDEQWNKIQSEFFYPMMGIGKNENSYPTQKI
jgi:glycine cleavage system H protein